MSNLKKCNECGASVPEENATCHSCGYSFSRKVSWRLIISCIIMPGIFCWFLLRKGYSKKVKIAGVACGLIGVILAIEAFMELTKATDSQGTTLESTNVSSANFEDEIFKTLRGKEKELGLDLKSTGFYSGDFNSDNMLDYFVEVPVANEEQTKAGHGTYQAILLSEGAEYRIAYERVAGLNSSQFVVKSTENGRIEGIATLYAKDDPLCCPSITKSAMIQWNGASFEQNWVDNSPFSFD
jgi:hypothetical protein